MTQAEPMTLFPEPRRCDTCGQTADRCAHDDDVSHGLKEASSKRPKDCLNAWDPQTAEIPF